MNLRMDEHDGAWGVVVPVGSRTGHSILRIGGLNIMRFPIKAILASVFVSTLMAAHTPAFVGAAMGAAQTVDRPIHPLAHSHAKKATPTMVSDGFLRVGTKVPTFDLLTLNRKGKTSLKELLGKKPLIINAFASWCPPCQFEAPLLEKAAKRYGKQVTFIGVNLTKIDSIAGARKFTKKYHISYPVQA